MLNYPGKNMKSLKPSMREKKRYLLVKGKNLENIEKAIVDFIGNSGLAKTALRFISKDDKNDKAIISVNRNMVNQVRASLVIWPEKIEVKKVSGTLRGLRG